ncbi:MAG TPA: protoporphyrinogen oxidase [Elusimicrobia bacterium]|nr:protoporphyrinogen oxidase [Elusimicrobiota bacterium]
MTRTDVLVIGGGLAGLSTAWHLRRLGLTSVLVVEKEARPGGRAGTVEKDGFLFDQTGHLLHLHDPYGRKLILRLLAGNLSLRERSSWIHSHGVFTRYPFQANTFGLPRGVVEDCVALFAKSRYRPARLGKAPSFERWCLAAFGEGISRHFMFPYNAKLWRAELSELTTEWQGRFLPRPSPEEVLYGALFDQKKFFGYNAAFRYPLRGGIQVLPDALARGVPGLRLEAELERVDLDEKVAVVKGLGEVRYERLVNTMPLPFFLDKACALPKAVRTARAALRWRDVYNLNIGIARADVSDKHWIYFPEKRFAFYRAGFLTNFSKSLAPRGMTSMYIEVSRRPEERPSKAALERRILAGLRSCGLLKASDRLAARHWFKIDAAYVLYDRARTPAVAAAMAWLRSRGAESIGRWGAWKYSFMEETLLDGKACAQRLAGRRGVQHIDEAELAPLR